MEDKEIVDFAQLTDSQAQRLASAFLAGYCDVNTISALLIMCCERLVDRWIGEISTAGRVNTAVPQLIAVAQRVGCLTQLLKNVRRLRNRNMQFRALCDEWLAGVPMDDADATMPGELPTDLKQELVEVLSSVFSSYESIDAAVYLNTGKLLKDFVKQAPLLEMFPMLVYRAHTGGWLKDLVRTVSRRAPRNPKLLAFCQKWPEDSWGGRS